MVTVMTMPVSLQCILHRQLIQTCSITTPGWPTRFKGQQLRRTSDRSVTCTSDAGREMITQTKAKIREPLRTAKGRRW